jgi:hypothetical protein
MKSNGERIGVKLRLIVVELNGGVRSQSGKALTIRRRQQDTSNGDKYTQGLKISNRANWELKTQGLHR